MKLIYVAGPYRGKDRWEVAQNIHRAEYAGLEIANVGGVPVIPHSNYSSFDGTQTDDYWLKATTALLARCDAAYFIRGWTNSEGSKAEDQYCIDHKIPRFEHFYQVYDYVARPTLMPNRWP